MLKPARRSDSIQPGPRPHHPGPGPAVFRGPDPTTRGPVPAVSRGPDPQSSRGPDPADRYALPGPAPRRGVNPYDLEGMGGDVPDEQSRDRPARPNFGGRIHWLARAHLDHTCDRSYLTSLHGRSGPEGRGLPRRMVLRQHILPLGTASKRAVAYLGSNPKGGGRQMRHYAIAYPPPGPTLRRKPRRGGVRKFKYMDASYISHPDETEKLQELRHW